MNVLIVDDDVPFLNTLQNRIDWQSLSVDTVFTACTAGEAEAILQKHAISLMVTDVEMPGQSGLDLIDWCRENLVNCAVIILSSFPDFSYAQRAMSLGVGAYLLKGSRLDELEDMMKKMIAKLLRENPVNQSAEAEKKSAHVERIIHYISQHISEPIRRDDLAAYIGFTPEYLSSYFKKETGYSLNNYITNEKVLFSKKLLLQTDLPISIIAQNLGFETSSHFTSCFRKSTGMTPREYRKNYVPGT